MANSLPLFPIDETLGIEVNYKYAGNGILLSGDGREYRNAPHPHPLAEYRFRRDLLPQWRETDGATLKKIRDFLDNLKGKSGRFRYRDPMDFEATKDPFTIHQKPNGQVNPLSDNNQPIIAQTQGILKPEPDGSRTEFQLCKKYEVGRCKPVAHYRVITRPAIGDYTIYTQDGAITESLSIVIYSNDSEISEGVSVDPTTGKVTFDTAPDSSSVLTWEGVFDVPCQLGNDIFEISPERVDTAIDNWLYNLEQLEIKEVREKSDINPIPDFSPFIDIVFPVDTTYESGVGRAYSTLETESSSGFVLSQPQYAESIPRYEMPPQQNLSPREKEFLICLWRGCLGNVSSFFRFEPSFLEDIRLQSSSISNISNQLRTVRFDSNSLPLEYLANNNNPFRLAEMKASEFKKVADFYAGLCQIDQDTFVIAIADGSGSMDESLPQISDAMDDFFPLFRDIVHSGDNTAASEKYLGYSTRSDEQWLLWAAESLEQANLETGKLLAFLWCNESAPNDESESAYHSRPGLGIILQEPTSTFNNDLNRFLTAYNNSVDFRAILYAVELDTNTGEAFEEHVVNAVLGQSGYNTALQNYGFEYQLRVPPDTSTETYLSEVTGASDGGDISSPVGVYGRHYTTNARCCLIQRTDGVNIAVTNCSYPLVRNGITYEPEAGEFTNTAKSRELETNDVSMDGVLISTQVDASDFALGLYDNASIEIFAVDWRNPDSDRAVFFSGYFSTSEIQGTNQGAQRIKMNFRSWDGLTEQKWLVPITERCGLEFGGTACGVDLAPLTDSLTIDSVTNNREFTVTSTRASGFFDRGHVIFSSGDNASPRKWVVANFDGSTFTLAQSLPFAPQVGDSFTGVAGCSKLLNDDQNGCASYNNTENFARGLAGATYLPGSKTLGGANQDVSSGSGGSGGGGK